ncbi:MAG TPA: hypothetical protein ENH26_01415 [Candidatus Wolfebacteria bacterium]|nr:hypothetical protein [Candidatus Wolfebacteria bacterium]
MDRYQIISLIIQGLIAFGAFGGWQLIVSKRKKRLQEIITVSIESDKDFIKFFNTGKINLYIHNIEVKDEKTRQLIGEDSVFDEPRLLVAGTAESSYYEYPISKDLLEYKKIRFCLFLTDELGKKWFSEHGGEINNGEIRVWSYKNYEKEWSL